MKCPKCQSENHIKYGHINGRQRYKCKECHHSYTVEKKSSARTNEQKRQALEMYLEGNGFRAIGRLLNVSNVSVLKWIRNFGKQIVQYRNTQPAKIIEMDELHTYIKKKTIVGSGLLLIDLVKGISIVCLGAGLHEQEKNYGS